MKTGKRQLFVFFVFFVPFVVTKEDTLALTNVYQHNTSASKLRGQYYTPAEFVQLILSELQLSRQDRLLDPSCGDGSFLCSAVAALAATLGEAVTVEAAARLADQLIGFDINAEAVDNARVNLQQAFQQSFQVELPLERFQLYQVNALHYPSLPALFDELALPAVRATERLLVIGNPPYVEAKRLDNDTKERLKSLYPAACSGAPDLYLYFLHVCLGWLRGQDVLAFVLPNKILVNANARQIRHNLLARRQLAGIWFATQANIFPDAMVYPVVVFAGGENPGGAAALQQIVRAERGLQPEPMASVSLDLYRHTDVLALFPFPRQQELRGLLERMLTRHDRLRLADVCDIHWCVSFHRSGLRNQFVVQAAPVSAHGRKFLGGGAFSGNSDVSRYAIHWSGWWIDYDEEQLRREGNMLPALSIFTRPKIVICQNGRTIRAAYDEHEYILKDTFFCGLVKADCHPFSRAPRALLGILNSKLVHFFYAHVFYGGHVQGGYLHFLKNFLGDIPLGEWTEDTARHVDTLVRQRELTTSSAAQLDLEAEIERIVGQSFNLSPREDLLLQRWVEEDENWRAKDRIRLAKPMAK